VSCRQKAGKPMRSATGTLHVRDAIPLVTSRKAHQMARRLVSDASLLSCASLHVLFVCLSTSPLLALHVGVGTVVH
jgi:hypothetical protein